MSEKPVGWEASLYELREIAGVEFYGQIGPKIIELKNRIKELEEHQLVHDRVFARQALLIEQLRSGS